jgi:myosin heavy subunit
MNTDGDFDDMVMIDDLSEVSIMENLKKRYARKQIYVSLTVSLLPVF